MLLISVFGGILNGLAVVVTLLAGASGGGMDFISIFMSERKGKDAWNLILLTNSMILLTAGFLFGFEKALYSIIFQYCNTQIIKFFYRRYQKHTLLIITDKTQEIYEQILNTPRRNLICRYGMLRGYRKKDALLCCKQRSGFNCDEHHKGNRS